jgi:hypothetical protein
MKSLHVVTLFFVTNGYQVSGSFCNWGPDGEGSSSVCEGGEQGGEWCNASGNNCESGCGGRWCTSGGGGPPPAPEPDPTPAPQISAAGFCNWGPDGSGASSVCEGGAQGGAYCNASGNNCESDCTGRWCTSGGGAPTPGVGGGECPPGWNQASWTTYTSYAPCCEDSPNYDPSADTTECELYSACDYTGQFAYIEQKSFEWVQNNNIVAFFSTQGDNSDFGNKMIRIAASGTTVEALVADTCGDDDCNMCCSTNAEPSGYLVDMEYWTVVNNFGDISAAQGQTCWQLVV